MIIAPLSRMLTVFVHRNTENCDLNKISRKYIGQIFQLYDLVADSYSSLYRSGSNPSGRRCRMNWRMSPTRKMRT